MHFTIERMRLIKMLENVRRKLAGQKKKEKDVRLYACAARVFTEANGVVGGHKALVLVEGGCTAALEPLLTLLKTYDNKEHVTIQADERALHMFTTTWPIRGYTRQVSPPGNFAVGSVTDTWLATRQEPQQTGRDS
ncbi:hypothetical protein SBV1_1770005 [Verrucomicrobia bacterium]|nr:hypothetical protein SBV1_1770005 [Verrucomicrobiota bacterium]